MLKHHTIIGIRFQKGRIWKSNQHLQKKRSCSSSSSCVCASAIWVKSIAEHSTNRDMQSTIISYLYYTYIIQSCLFLKHELRLLWTGIYITIVNVSEEILCRSSFLIQKGQRMMICVYYKWPSHQQIFKVLYWHIDSCQFSIICRVFALCFRKSFREKSNRFPAIVFPLLQSNYQIDYLPSQMHLLTVRAHNQNLGMLIELHYLRLVCSVQNIEYFLVSMQS